MSILVVFSVLINLICVYILTKLTGNNMLTEPCVLPPIAIIQLLVFPLKRKSKKRSYNESWIKDNLKITDDEYKYLIRRASDIELDIIFHEPTNYSEKKRIIEIKYKYLTLYRYDLIRH